jgi:hypothetical protein
MCLQGERGAFLLGRIERLRDRVMNVGDSNHNRQPRCSDDMHVPWYTFQYLSDVARHATTDEAALKHIDAAERDMNAFMIGVCHSA